MITGTLIALALILGYLVAAGLSMLVTFAVAKASPEFVARDHMLKTGYRFFQAAVWMVCVTVGGYLSALVGAVAMRSWLADALLAALLILVLWSNTWEARQRGLIHQFLMSAVTLAGVAAGHYLAILTA